MVRSWSLEVNIKQKSKEKFFGASIFSEREIREGQKQNVGKVEDTGRLCCRNKKGEAEEELKEVLHSARQRCHGKDATKRCHPQLAQRSPDGGDAIRGWL